MNDQIDNIPLPTDRRICTDCRILKPLNEFSLKVGKNNSLRKTHCVKCESARRTKKKQYGLSDSEWSILLSLPCSICGIKAETVHVSGANPKTSLPLGVLCLNCFKLLPNTVGKQELLERAAIYLELSRQFPFWCRLVLEAKTSLKIQSQTPLFDAFVE